MSASTTVKELVQRNKHFATSYTPVPYISELESAGVPSPKIIIITCADPRCVPEQFLHLRGIEAVAFRNVCGHIVPNLPMFLALDSELAFEEIMVIHHTDCGGLMIKDNKIRKTLKERAPEHAADVDRIEDFGGVTDLQQSVRAEIAAIKASPLMRKELAKNVYGYIFDIKTGLLAAVESGQEDMFG